MVFLEIFIISPWLPCGKNLSVCFFDIDSRKIVDEQWGQTDRIAAGSIINDPVARKKRRCICQLKSTVIFHTGRAADPLHRKRFPADPLLIYDMVRIYMPCDLWI